MSIAKHTGYNVAGALVPIAVSLATVPLYLSTIGLARYGVLALCWVFLGLTGLFSIGMGPAVAQRIAALAKESEQSASRIFWTAIFLGLLTGVVAGFVLYLTAFAYFMYLSDNTTSFLSEIEAALPFLALLVPSAMLNGIFAGALQGRERFFSLNLITSFGSVAMATLPLAFAYLFGPDLWKLIVAGLLAKTIESTWLFIECRRALHLRSPERPDRRSIKDLLSFGGWASISSVLGPLLETADRFAIGALVGPGAVALYSIAYNLVSRVSLAPGSLARALLPRFASSNEAARRGLEVEGTRAVVAVMTPLAIVLIGAGGPFLSWWLGPALGEKAKPIVYLLVFGFWINAVAYIPYVSLQGRGRPDLVAKLQLLYVAPYFTVLFLAVTWFGAVGAAIAWSARSFFDPALFIMSGTMRQVLPIIAPGVALVGVSVPIAFVFDWHGAAHWVALLTILIAACVFAIRLQVSSISTLVEWLRRRRNRGSSLT